MFGLSDDADAEVRCITRGRPGTEIRIGPLDDLESLGITTGDILQVRDAQKIVMSLMPHMPSNSHKS